jgi:hypothetical protein
MKMLGKEWLKFEEECAGETKGESIISFGLLREDPRKALGRGLIKRSRFMRNSPSGKQNPSSAYLI